MSTHPTATLTVAQLKDSGQDFEWYPTTREIISRLYQELTLLQDRSVSVLDCGAGNGKVFYELEQCRLTALQSPDRATKNLADNLSITKYAIEKARPLLDSLPPDVFVVGTDFHEQSLIDKTVDVIFCNPPYSEYIAWTEKILREGAARVAYLVIPGRWQLEPRLADLIERRNLTASVVDSYDFLHSEDRVSRARVQLVRIAFSRHSDDAFTFWFNEHFPISVSPSSTQSYFSDQVKRVENNLVQTADLIPGLVASYNHDLEHLLSNYSSLNHLDPELLGELDVSLSGLKKALQLKITGLKNVYWHILFDRLAAITDRLTKESRDRLLSTLTRHTHVDFTRDNILSIVVWAVKNANQYFSDQLLSVYMRLSDQNNIRLYRSNTRVIQDDWRYLKSDMSHYALDYRIIITSFSTFSCWDHEKHNGMNKATVDIIADLFVVARNLGFDVHPSDLRKAFWYPGEREAFFDSHGSLFVDVRVFKNGNIHLRFAPQFMQRLNVEAARLHGWIKSPQDAVAEFDIPFADACAAFGSNLSLDTTVAPALLTDTRVAS